MNRNWRTLWRVLIHSSDFGWYLALIIALPTLILAVLGIFFLTTSELLLPFLFVWSLLTLLLGGCFFYRQRKSMNATLSDATLDSIPSLQPAADWTPQDHTAWQLAQAFIEERLQADTPWADLRELAITQHTLVASHYVPVQKNHELSFTLPELLLVLEVTSERYRQFIRQHIPFAESVQLATLKTLYDQRDTARKGYQIVNIARRLLRLTNPLAAASGELRDHVSGKVLGRAGHKLSLELKRVLLQELAQVAIDLYSGRLKVSDAELSEYVSAAARADQQRQAKPVEPLRIAVAGQINAGKSTLINALRDNRSIDTEVAQTTRAETDLLPSTDAVTNFRWQLSNQSPALFIDTPGLDGSAQSHELVIEQAAAADVVLWVCKANQPARAEDVKALSSIKRWYTDHAERIPPPVLVVMTHSDRLRPINEWNPPYSVDEGENGAIPDPANVKECNIHAAISSLRQALDITADTPVIATALPPATPTFNVHLVISTLEGLAIRASNTQLNRRRVQRVTESTPWSSRLKQLGSLLQRLLER